MTATLAIDAPPGNGAAALVAFVEETAQGEHALDLVVEGVHCGGCVRRIEQALSAEADVVAARVNLTTRRLALRWRGGRGRAAALAATVERLGFRVAPWQPARPGADDERAETELLRALAVAGFAAGNVMLLSVAVWSGAVQGMGAATRDLLHWFSALIALPAVAYAGLPFFRSALAALRHGRTNMDVPISIGVLLASAISLSETLRGGEHAYFDSAIALLFFLLVGRYLDRRARGRARAVASRLLALSGTTVTLLQPDGTARAVPAAAVTVGAKVLVAPGERVAVDGRVVTGTSELDASAISGETLPQAATVGDRVFAGVINLAAPLTIQVTAVGERTLLAEIVRLMECAEQRRARHVALADRVARAYAPVVHGLAALTFLGWTLLGGIGWESALLYAVAVLIVTCPCALALAVPVVQVIASGRLFQGGVLLKSATALERLATVDMVVFDKTGTLTEGRPVLIAGENDRDALAVAAALAGASRHPLARALVAARPDVPVAEGVREVPGRGLALGTPQGEVRLGSRLWCGVGEDGVADEPELWLARPGVAPVRFAFHDALRADAATVIGALHARGLDVRLLSGDRPAAVERAAAAAGIAPGDWEGALSPADKVTRLEALAAAGRRVLMVGDGLNDAPALAAALVSLSPASAADISQTAADAVFQGARLAPVVETLDVARRVARLVRQNFALALLYNALTIPLAVAGFVTPLIAALAMSTSSLAVIGNALRLNLGRRG